MLNHRTCTAVREQDRVIETGGVGLRALLARPEHARSILVLAHEATSHRYSPRNRYLACAFQAAGFATLSADLLTDEEGRQDVYTERLRFDVSRLAGRLDSLTEWVLRDACTRDLSIGYFGIDVGALAVLVASLQRPQAVGAIVCYDGAVELASNLLADVRPPVLFLVGAREPTPMGRITTNLNFLTQPAAAGDRRALAQRDGRFGYQLCTGCTIESIAHPFAERLDGKGVYNGNRNTKCRGHQEGRCGPVVLGRAH